jgi:Uma2 family endonuclease
MAQPKPRIKFTVKDYMTTPEDKRYQLLDGELILAPSPTTWHQRILLRLYRAVDEFVASGGLGEVLLAPCDVVLSDHDVFEPDLLFVSNDRSNIVTTANLRGAPDMVVEVLSPGTARYDRGYKQTLYSRHGVREYWLVDPDAGTVEVLAASGQGLAPVAAYTREDTLTSPLLAGLSIDLAEIFRGI